MNVFIENCIGPRGFIFLALADCIFDLAVREVRVQVMMWFVIEFGSVGVSWRVDFRVEVFPGDQWDCAWGRGSFPQGFDQLPELTGVGSAS